MNITIVVPNTGTIQQRTVVSLTGMVYHTAKSTLPIGLDYHSPAVTGMPRVRNTGASIALKDKSVTHILWVDSDMTFPHDALERLLKHDLPIVGCIYNKRDGSGIVGTDKDGKQLTDEYWNYDGVMESRFLGFGLMLIKREVFEAIGFPFFEEMYAEDGQLFSEDVMFLLKASDHGYKTYADITLSKEVGHLGTVEF